jgi:hypothetical protein
MLLYSKKIIKFIQDITHNIKEILSKEVGLKAFGNRFHDRQRKYSYPIKVVIYNHKKELGYFDANFFELGFHECLMNVSREQLRNIIRHELAHYILFIERGGLGSTPHGEEFRACCQRLGWGEEVYRASMQLEKTAEPDEEEGAVLRKVQKLMALSTSSNQHEAELAMIKSQELLLKHNLEFAQAQDKEDEKIILTRIMKQKKENAKMRSIARILETFFVSVVYRHQTGHIYLEVIGSKVNVEIAEYVAATLEHTLDMLWNHAQRQQPMLKGMVAKNSFFFGVAQGYCNKIQSLKRQHDTQSSNALMMIEKQLLQAQEMVYPRLSHSRSSARHCSTSASYGEQAGKGLTINPAVGNTAKPSGAYLPNFRS